MHLKPLFPNLSFSVNKIALFQQILLTVVEPGFDSLDFVVVKLLGNAVGAQKLVLLVLASGVKLHTKMKVYLLAAICMGVHSGEPSLLQRAGIELEARQG